jgi:hypothetical protein
MSGLAFAFEYPFAFSEGGRVRAVTDVSSPPQPAGQALGLSAHDPRPLCCASNGMADESIAIALKQDAAFVHQTMAPHSAQSGRP